MPRPSLRALLALEAVLLLALAEGFLAWKEPDLRLLESLLYYQGGHLELYRPSGDPELLYELRPGASGTFNGVKISVNALGFRGAPAAAQKARGKFRIICFGTSNTFGPRAGDAETYPARLEALLNRRAPGRYEVWNAGLSAYTVRQTLAAARKALERYSPDLLLLQLNNVGRRPYLYGVPPGGRLLDDPSLFRENLRYVWPEKLDFLRRWRLLRTVLIWVNLRAARSDPQGYEHALNGRLEPVSAAALGDFLARTSGRVPVMLLVGIGGEWLARVPEADAVPKADLLGKIAGKTDPEYREVHPKPYVYEWYAAEIAGALVRTGLPR